jgi:hypothetical protein
MLQYYSFREVIQFIDIRNLRAAFRENHWRSVSPNFPRSAKLRDAHILSGIRKVAEKLPENTRTKTNDISILPRHPNSPLSNPPYIRNPRRSIRKVSFMFAMRCNHWNSGISQENIQYTSRTVFYTVYDFIFLSSVVSRIFQKYQTAIVNC